MNAMRLAVSCPDLDARGVVAIACAAEAQHLTLWIGSPDPGPDAPSDSYVTAAAAAAVGVTRQARIGLFLHLPPSEWPLRIAEDVGVLDRASGGRIGLGLVPPETDHDAWATRVTAMLGAWASWPAQEGRTVAATPGPVQPWIPRVVLDIGTARELAPPLAAGILHWSDRGPLAPAPGFGVLAIAVGDDPRGWLMDGGCRQLMQLRRTATSLGATELLLVVDGDDVARLEGDVAWISRVAGSALRASPHEMEIVFDDALRWTETR